MDNKIITNGLNERQLEAVNHLGGPILILAGAGSGKTKTLTHRIANLILHGVNPNRILAVTFTNKAANEMRERLWGLLEKISANNKICDFSETAPAKSFMPYMGTFHGIAVKFLRQEASSAGLNANFVIYDTDDQISLIRRAMKELKLNDSRQLRPKSVQSIISAEKNQGNGPEEYAAKALYPNQKQIADIFFYYEKEKTKAGALDFDDLLLKEYELLKNNMDVRQKWQNKFQHILIDEYQDTNSIQYNIVKLLINEQKNICVVGDDWQSIYSWRGADFTNILNFERDFPGAKVIKLEQNYRSTGNILEASQKIINKNKTRTDKNLFTNAGKGEPIDIESLQDETAEANFVALSILNLKKEFPDYSDFAILYRTNAQSYAFEKALMNMHIPYKIVGGVRFYDRKEVKDVLAILRLVINQRDKVSLGRVANNVLSGVGEVSLAKILTAIDLVDSKTPLCDLDYMTIIKAGRARKSFEKLANFIKETNVDGDPGEIVKQVIQVFDFKALTDDGTPASDDRMANLEVLTANVAEYSSLEDFLADAALMSSVDEKTKKNSVTLMTMHAAKGLEFPVVYIVGMEEGLFPSERASEDEAGLEEERRLAYVGMTRAMQRLFLTYAASRYSYGSRNYNMPSRFLIELGYNPYGSAGYSEGAIYDDEFSSEEFNDFGMSEVDPFPDDLPVFE